jgi:hypothetical protein
MSLTIGAGQAGSGPPANAKVLHCAAVIAFFNAIHASTFLRFFLIR